MDITSYVSGITANISNQTQPNTIPPSTIGSGYVDLANITATAVNNLTGVTTNLQGLIATVSATTVSNSASTIINTTAISSLSASTTSALALKEVLSNKVSGFTTGDTVSYPSTLAVATAITGATSGITSLQTSFAPLFTTGTTTRSYGTFPTFTGTIYSGAATIGKALTNSTLSKLIVRCGVAGSVNLLVCTLISGSTLTVNTSIPLTTSIVGDNTFSATDFGVVNLTAGQFIAIQTVSGSTYYTSTTGVQNYHTEAALTTTMGWTSVTTAKYSAYFETTEVINNVLSIDTPVLSTSVQSSLASAAAIPALQTTVSAHTATLASISKVSDIILATGVTTQLGNYPTFTGSNSNGAALRATLGIVTVNSILTKVVVKASAIGAFNLIIYNKTSTATFTQVSVIPLAFSVIGDNTFTAADFGLINLTAGQYVGVQLLAGAGNGSSYYTSTTGADTYYSSSTSTATTLNFTQTSVFKYFGYFEVGTPIVSVPEANLSASVLSKLNNPQFVQAPRTPTLVYSTGFNASGATDWAVTSGWSYTANGLLSPTGATDWNQKAYQNNLSGPSNEESIRRFYFTPQSTGVKFAAGTYASTGYAGTNNKSTLFSISDAENLIKFYQTGLNTWSGETSVYSTAPLTPLVAGRAYMIEMKRYRRTNTITVYDTITNVVMGTLVNDYLLPTDNLNTGAQVGSFLIVNQIGQTLFSRVTLSHAVNKPRLFAMGDSISEGLTVNLSDRWAQMVSNDLKGAAALNGISGSRMSEIPQKLLYDIPAMQPQWILSYFNHNDGDGAGSNVTTIYNQLMAYCQTNNINLAVCCLAPQPTFGYPLFNAYVMSLPGWVRKVRMDLALTTNNDGVTYNAAVYNDAHHPNPAGNILEYNRIKMDIPELFY